MAKDFLPPLPRPGDGAWLLQQSVKKRRPRKKVKTFLRQSPTFVQDEVEVKNQDSRVAFPETLAQLHVEWQERSTSHPPPNSFIPSIIANDSLLSHDLGQNDTLAPTRSDAISKQALESKYPFARNIDVEDEAMAPVTRAGALPPHLRNKTGNKPTPPPQPSAEEAQPNGDIQTLPVRSANGVNGAHIPDPPVNGAEMRKKLAEEHNVTVTSPKPTALVPYASSNEEHKNHPNGFRGHQPKSSTAESKRGKPARRGRGSRAGRQARQSRWPTAAEQRPDPKRWEMKWDSASERESSTADSAWADAGYGDGTAKKRQIDDGTGRDNGFKLTDWSGNWAPAPVDWDSRPSFRDGQSVQKIEQWLDKIEEEMTRALGTRSWTIPRDNITADGCTYYFAPDPKKPQLPMVGDIAPRYWIPVAFGGEARGTVAQAPQTFWSELIKSDMPIPYDEDDLVGVKPWWETYQVIGGNFLKHYETPSLSGIDPDENEDERIAREHDRGSHFHAENRKNKEKAKKDAQRDKRKNAQKKVRKLSEAAVEKQNEDRIKPGIKLFLRSARPDDIPRIREIYNYYVDNSVCVPETVRRTDTDMRERLNDVRYNLLPFLVACERGSKIPARRKKDIGEEIILPDKVVGFALADDYNDMQGMYRFTAEIELFVDKDYYMKGVAKCLLDKLMALLDPMYIPKGGYDVVGEDLEGWGCGAQRRISNLVINVPYDPNNMNRMVWLEKGLLGWVQFEKVGDLRGIGLKDGKSVNLAIFQRKTGEEINPQLPPVTMSYPLK